MAREFWLEARRSMFGHTCLIWQLLTLLFLTLTLILTLTLTQSIILKPFWQHFYIDRNTDRRGTSQFLPIKINHFPLKTIQFPLKLIQFNSKRISFIANSFINKGNWRVFQRRRDQSLAPLSSASLSCFPLKRLLHILNFLNLDYFRMAAFLMSSHFLKKNRVH